MRAIGHLHGYLTEFPGLECHGMLRRWLSAIEVAIPDDFVLGCSTQHLPKQTEARPFRCIYMAQKGVTPDTNNHGCSDHIAGANHVQPVVSNFQVLDCFQLTPNLVRSLLLAPFHHD